MFHSYDYTVEIVRLVLIISILILWGFSGGSGIKNPPAKQQMQEIQVQSLGGEDPLKEDMATYSSILTWRIPWTEEPGGL